MLSSVRASRLVASILAVPLLWAVLGAAPAAAENVTIRIGYQKYGTLILAADRHVLEPKLATTHDSVTWREFPGGPQLLEALAAGSVDFGITGEAPPIFALAAGTPLVYVGVEPASPKGEAILVAADSPIHGVADLKGKRVALNKGSNVHFLLVQALAKYGVDLKDITPVYLAPADGRAAFQSGAVDAWVIWDPYFAAGQAATKARVLVNGEGLAPNRQYFVATRDFVTRHPEVVRTTLAAIAETDAWAAAHPGETAQLLSQHTNIPVDILKEPVARLGYGVVPIDAAAIATQQQIADSFFRLGLIPRHLDIRSAVWENPS